MLEHGREEGVRDRENPQPDRPDGKLGTRFAGPSVPSRNHGASDAVGERVGWSCPEDRVRC